MKIRRTKLAAAILAASVPLATGTALAGGGPPPPTSTNGHHVQLVASGLGTPTAFAFGDNTVFESDFGGGSSTGPQGGVYVLAHGKATRVPGSPKHSFGIVWHNNALYVSAGKKLLLWSGWNGKKFAKQRVIYRAPKGFTAFNGLGFGANGRLYAGVDNGPNDHGAPTTPYEYDILTFAPTGGKPTVFARGIRQPWQMAFPAGSNSPYVSDLGQDSGASNPPDFVLRVKAGQNYGFPTCNWTVAWSCAKYARPFWFFSPHTDVMGQAIAGKRLYMTDFGVSSPPRVTYMPLSGGKAKPLLKGFVAPVVGLGINGKWLYVGELTGQVYRVKL